jgi:hypothetical protein
MDDAVVEYSRSAGLLTRFRMSTVDTPVASGAFMRPSVPANNLLAARVAEQLAMVRNRMFRLDSMLKDGNTLRCMLSPPVWRACSPWSLHPSLIEVRCLGRPCEPVASWQNQRHHDVETGFTACT